MAPRAANTSKTCVENLIPLILSDTFADAFDVDAPLLDPKPFFRWLCTQTDDHTKAVIAQMQLKVVNRGSASIAKTLFPDGSPILQELGSEQMRQILKAAHSIASYSRMDRRVLDYCRQAMMTGPVSWNFIIGSKYIPSRGRKNYNSSESVRTFATDVPTIFEALLYFHSLVFCERERHAATMTGPAPLKTDRSKSTGNRIGFAVQLIINAWNKFAVGVGLGQCSTLIAPYILFNSETKLFMFCKT